MRIGIDCHALGQINSGNVTYIDNLVSNLRRLDRENTYHLYLSGARRVEEFKGYPANFNCKVVAPHSLWLRLPFTLPRELRRNPVDIMHVTYVAPLRCSCPVIVAIHDVCWERLPREYYTAMDRIKRRYLVRRTANMAKTVIVVSEHTKRDVMELYGVSEEKIEVIYAGVAPDFQVVDDPQAIACALRKYNIVGEFILYVGRLDKRKNIPALMKAFRWLKLEKGMKGKLVIVGEKSYLYAEVFGTLRELRIEEDVVFLSRVPLEDLVLLYNAAEVFVFPSLYEGFGFAPLEAMACGTPIVASNRTSIPEVVGDAGILVDPEDVVGLGKAIDSVLRDGRLRSELREKGLKRVKRFSWERTALKTLGVYEKVGGGLR